MALKSAYRRSPCTRTTSRCSGCRGRAIPFATSSSFGLSSAPKLFTAVADGKGVANSLHYLDFGWRQALRLRTGLVYGRANMLQARAQTAIVFLGILVDSVRQEVRLPDDKLARLLQELRTWGVKRAATKRQLQSLLGILNHAASLP